MTGKVIYTAITSLDGFIEDVNGRFDWAVPDEEVHTFCNGLEANVGIHLYGRRMYETMAVWERIGDGPEVSVAEAEYAETWRGLDKVVFSRTLDDVRTSRTRLERDFDPDAVLDLKRSADRDISVSGPSLARHAFSAGLVDEIHLIVVPVIVGGGKAGLPGDVRAELELVDVRRFANGAVHLHHRSR